MRSSTSHPAPDERGFILVGVVTFMLALTILGLSLFALSSYEAQFFVVSASREQSLQNSESGMELVKTLIAAPDSRLEWAHRAEGQFGITSAMAYQWRSGLATDTTSQGPVQWDSTLVIVVAAKSGGVQRSLQAKFIPTAAENPYHKLLAAEQGIAVNTVNSPSPSVLQLSGPIWQPVNSDADTAWAANVTRMSGGPIDRGTPPVPLATDFVSQNPGVDMTNIRLGNAGSYELRMEIGSSSPTFYHSPPSPTAAGETNKNYTFYTGADLAIRVSGVSVWVVPKGVRFDNLVSVSQGSGGATGTLIIVATANGRDGIYGGRGIWFNGGLTVTSGVRVYLVSDGDIAVTQQNEYNNDNSAMALSIVAGGRIEIGGPDAGHAFQLGYDPAMDALADQLLAQGALPPVMGGSGGSFVAMRPSWTETTPR